MELDSDEWSEGQVPSSDTSSQGEDEVDVHGEVRGEIELSHGLKVFEVMGCEFVQPHDLSYSLLFLIKISVSQL